MDFSAWFEVFLDGRWFTFDARHNHPRIGRVVMCRGRDAADVAISTASHTIAGRTRDTVAEAMHRLAAAKGLARIRELLAILDLLASSRDVKPIASAGFVPQVSTTIRNGCSACSGTLTGISPMKLTERAQPPRHTSAPEHSAVFSNCAPAAPCPNT